MALTPAPKKAAVLIPASQTKAQSDPKAKQQPETAGTGNPGAFSGSTENQPIAQAAPPAVEEGGVLRLSWTPHPQEYSKDPVPGEGSQPATCYSCPEDSNVHKEGTMWRIQR